MTLDHDPEKARANRRKHGIDLACCRDAFDAPMLTREDDRDGYDEERFVSLGRAGAHIMVLVWSDRPDAPRLISCRKASRHEREIYRRAFPPD